MKLTPRETQVGECVMNGLKNKEIAQRLNITIRTVKHHICTMFIKRQIPSWKLQRILLAVNLHANRTELGIKCQACGEM